MMWPNHKELLWICIKHAIWNLIKKVNVWFIRSTFINNQKLLPFWKASIDNFEVIIRDINNRLFFITLSNIKINVSQYMLSRLFIYMSTKIPHNKYLFQQVVCFEVGTNIPYLPEIDLEAILPQLRSLNTHNVNQCLLYIYQLSL